MTGQLRNAAKLWNQAADKFSEFTIQAQRFPTVCQTVQVVGDDGTESNEPRCLDQAAMWIEGGTGDPEFDAAAFRRLGELWSATQPALQGAPYLPTVTGNGAIEWAGVFAAPPRSIGYETTRRFNPFRAVADRIRMLVGDEQDDKPLTKAERKTEEWREYIREFLRVHHLNEDGEWQAEPLKHKEIVAQINSQLARVTPKVELSPPMLTRQMNELFPHKERSGCGQYQHLAASAAGRNQIRDVLLDINGPAGEITIDGTGDAARDDGDRYATFKSDGHAQTQRPKWKEEDE